jgi:hypothetical protein
MRYKMWPTWPYNLHILPICICINTRARLKHTQAIVSDFFLTIQDHNQPCTCNNDSRIDGTKCRDILKYNMHTLTLKIKDYALHNTLLQTCIAIQQLQLNIANL